MDMIPVIWPCARRLNQTKTPDDQEEEDDRRAAIPRGGSARGWSPEVPLRDVVGSERFMSDSMAGLGPFTE